jgi:hypothetical protein
MQFKVGDRVRIPTWDELLKMGFLYQGDRNFIAFRTPDKPAAWGFIKKMEGSCGKIATITKIDPVSSDEYRLTFDDPSLNGIAPITNFMVTPAQSKYPTNKGFYVKAG